MASLLGELVRSITEAPQWFAQVALVDPLSALLVLVGVVFVGISVAVLGLLVLGALGELLTPELGTEPPRTG